MNAITPDNIKRDVAHTKARMDWNACGQFFNPYSEKNNVTQWRAYESKRREILGNEVQGNE